MEKYGLAERLAESSQNQTVYRVTELGFKVTDQYAEYRRDILVSMLKVQPEFLQELEKSINIIASMVGCYDQAGRRVVMLRSDSSPLTLKKKIARKKVS